MQVGVTNAEVFPFLFVLYLLLSACQPAPVPLTISPDVPAAEERPALSNERTFTPDSVEHSPSATSSFTATPPATVTVQPTRTITPIPTGWIQVNSLEQEVYPFVEHHNGSLAEAIYAANLMKTVDGLRAGVYIEEEFVLIAESAFLGNRRPHIV